MNDDLSLMRRDILRLGIACANMAKDIPHPEFILKDIRNATTVLKRAQSVDNLNVAARMFRDIFRNIHWCSIPDPTQGTRDGGIRYSGADTNWRRDGVDNSDIGA